MIYPDSMKKTVCVCVDVYLCGGVSGRMKQEAMTWSRTDMSSHHNGPSWFSTEHERVHHLFVRLLLTLTQLNITGVSFGSLNPKRFADIRMTVLHLLSAKCCYLALRN